MNTLFVNRDRFKWGPYIAYLIAILTLVGFFLYEAYEGAPSRSIVSTFVVVALLLCVCALRYLCM